MEKGRPCTSGHYTFFLPALPLFLWHFICERVLCDSTLVPKYLYSHYIKGAVAASQDQTMLINHGLNTIPSLSFFKKMFYLEPACDMEQWATRLSSDISLLFHSLKVRHGESAALQMLSDSNSHNPWPCCLGVMGTGVQWHKFPSAALWDFSPCVF